MVVHLGRAPENGAGQGIDGTPTAPRCGTTYSHLAALAVVFFFVWTLHGSTKVRCPGGRPSVYP